MDERQGIQMKNWYGIATALLILVIAFCVRGTVMSKESTEHIRENERYAVWEQTFKKDIREVLAGQGYQDSGITMNWVKRDGKRTYTVAVHHRRIGGLKKEERERLVQTLLQVRAGDEGCGIIFELQPHNMPTDID